MPKALFIFIFGVIFWQSAHAQKPDSVLLYMKESGQIVKNKDSADYFLRIMAPDSSTGLKVSLIKKFDTDNTLKLTTKAIIYFDGTKLSMKFVGTYAEYYPNGKLQMVMDPKKDHSVEILLYYPNGKLYCIEQNSIIHHHFLLIECRDSTGKVLTDKGNGRWIKFDQFSKQVFAEGPVVDSLEQGEWHELVKDSVKYTTTYNHGIAISSTDPNWGKEIFTAVEVEPHFKHGGTSGFNSFLATTIKYPAYDREHNIQGKVFVTFMVEKDGSLTNIKALRGPDKLLMDAAVEAVKQSPKWVPAFQNGRFVRVQYTIPVNFNLANK
jgi:TonB family protein